MPSFDAIIIGAGAMGSAAAYYLSKAGQRVLLLEQFEVDHQRGSSYGISRIIRYSYDDPRYVELAKANYPLWHALEEESGEELLIKTGGIDFGDADEPTLQETIAAVEASGIPHEILMPDVAQARFPQFTFGDEMTVLYQPDSGILKASASVKAHIRLAQKQGAQVIDNSPVTNITASSDSVAITAGSETYTAARLILACGAWTNDLIQHTGFQLPLTTWRCQLMFWEPDSPDKAMFNVDQMPVFIHHRGQDLYHVIYGTPNYMGAGVKAAFHRGEDVGHPKNVDYTPGDEPEIAMREVTREIMPALGSGELKSQRVCLYTMTPDHNFVVDFHPQHPNVLIAAGFSGHGFKFSTLIGKILSDLAVDGSTPHDISLFHADRFG